MAGTTWNTFAAGTKIRSAEVNENFDFLEGSIVPHSTGTQADAVYDLGTSTAQWNNVYVKTDVILDGTPSKTLSLLFSLLG